MDFEECEGRAKGSDTPAPGRKRNLEVRRIQIKKEKITAPVNLSKACSRIGSGYESKRTFAVTLR